MGQYRGFVQDQGMMHHLWARWCSIRGLFKIREWCVIWLDGQYQGFVQDQGMVRHMARWGSIRGLFKVMEWCVIGLDGAVSGVCSRSGNGAS